MANIKSAAKRARIAEKRRLRNRIYKSAIKAAVKRFEQALEAGNIDTAKTALVYAQKKLDQAVAKGILHRNTAARKKSKLTKRLNQAI